MPQLNEWALTCSRGSSVGTMAHLLGAEALHLEFPTRVIFDSLTLGLNDGDRIGVVGRNGDGKSSLLRLLAAKQPPDAGRVTWRGGIRLGLLDQSDDLSDSLTVRLAVFGDVADHTWATDARARDVVRGLLGGLSLDATIGSLSGGQRRRVSLAKLLIGDWDVILLDEPTNHLDIEGVAWLANHLKQRWTQNTGAVVAVTHDRWFLDEVSTTTWEVHDGVVEPFEGGYAAYILQRVERDQMAAASEARRQNLLRKELAWLRRGAPARTSKPKFRIEAANELIAGEPPVRDKVELEKLAMQRLGKDVVDLENVIVDFDSEKVLDGITWRIAPGERTGILGVNGAGKSTLLGLVAGRIAPTEGRVKRGKTVKIAELTQELAELEPIWNDRVSDVIARQKRSYLVGGKDFTPGQLLERIGFKSAQLSTRVKELSGGQKRRLQLLLILLEEPNLLILDEPTNDLDTDMLAAIEDLLDSFPGTLIVVSHDRYLVERVTDQQYAVLDGKLRHLPRGVDEYLALRRKQERSAIPERTGQFGEQPKPTEATKTVTGSKLQGSQLRAVEKELASIVRKLEKLSANIQAAHEIMAEHGSSDFEALTKLNKQLQDLEREKEELETRWLELAELTGV